MSSLTLRLSLSRTWGRCPPQRTPDTPFRSSCQGYCCWKLLRWEGGGTGFPAEVGKCSTPSNSVPHFVTWTPKKNPKTFLSFSWSRSPNKNPHTFLQSCQLCHKNVQVLLPQDTLKLVTKNVFPQILILPPSPPQTSPLDKKCLALCNPFFYGPQHWTDIKANEHIRNKCLIIPWGILIERHLNISSLTLIPFDAYWVSLRWVSEDLLSPIISSLLLLAAGFHALSKNKAIHTFISGSSVVAE